VLTFSSYFQNLYVLIFCTTKLLDVQSSHLNVILASNLALTLSEIHSKGVWVKLPNFGPNDGTFFMRVFLFLDVLNSKKAKLKR